MVTTSLPPNTDDLDVSQLLEILNAFEKGDFSVRMPINKTGLAGKVADKLNDVIERNELMVQEFERISTVVGKEGKSTQRATVNNANGQWMDAINSINMLISDLVQPMAETARVIRAVANGDLSQIIPLDIDGRQLKGEFLQTTQTINTMVEQLSSFASEVTRVAREVGTEGILGGQAEVKGVAGTWKDLTDSVNLMAGNLTAQVRNIADVTTAVANGDLSKKVTVDVKGEIQELKNTVNIMVDQLSSFASEVTRVAREVGTEGKLGVQAQVPGVAGTWKDLTDSVNSMAGNLTAQVRNIADVTTAVANGDLSKKVTVDVKGEILELKNTINRMVDQLSSFASEVTRVAREVGAEGILGGQADVKGVAGTWKDLTESVNFMAGSLTAQVRNVAEVTTSIANGDLSKKISVDVKGEMLELKNIINSTVDRLNSFASEVTRVAREVGTEGKLGVQAEVKGVTGIWKDLTDNVNSMAGNLTSQVRNIAEVTTAVANGDLSKKVTASVKGEILELKNTINTMVDQLNSFASEVTRVAREVGAEGILGGQADVKGVAGTWKDLTESVNFMAGSLTSQVRNIAEVTTAVANGNLSKKITVDVKGEMSELKSTINIMVDQLNSFASEVTRVAREVGTEGKLGVQAEVRGVAGTWKDLTDNVNSMAGNLTSQVRSIAEVTTAVANGDLSKKIIVDVKGEILELKNTINTMVDQLNSFASEVTRVAREVGTEGKLGVQAEVRGVAGTWKDLTDSVNSMAGSLTAQVRNIAEVTTAVANGNLSKKITVGVKGEMLELKNTINIMVDQLNSFASEVTRVAREVGAEGKLGVQAEVKGVAGTWKDLTDNVNFMAGSLTDQVRNIAVVTLAIANGDLSKKITVDVKGEILELKNTINTMVDQLNSFASEVTRVAREVGTEGKLGGQAYVRGVGGTWKDLTDNVNLMAGNLTGQVRNIAEVTKAVANGDLSKKIAVDVKGEMLELKDTINTMVDQLNSFASEVTRVAKEVGTEGKLGGQAEVKGVAGTWKDLTDSVNLMASNLTAQVRGIARIVTSVANGDLKRKLVLEAKGEIETLADTINEMIDTLATFADQVTTVAREVGIEGKLGGQAKVPGASGTWRDLTDNVNELAANLTTQVRAIAEVAIAVTRGDLTRSIAVDTQGEVAVLKDNINQMIANLRETTQKNTEQDWLKTNLAKFTRMLQGQRDLETVSKLILSELAPLVSAQHGVFYLMDSSVGAQAYLKLLSTYAFNERQHLANRFQLGEGLVGQCALEKERILLTRVPRDYIRISSGLGEAPPLNVVVLPILFEGQVTAVTELASFDRFSEIHLTFLDQLTESIGIVLNTIAAGMRTEELLKQSQSLTEELQSQQKELTETNKQLEQKAKSLQTSEELLKNQQEELQNTNAELQEKAKLLSNQNEEVERKNREIDLARLAIEEKATQLALTSKYKSEFLANMSHELRTPLNSLLLLARLLSQNNDGSLSEKQVEYAATIHSAGTDLLALINDILDLAKIESGTISVQQEYLPLPELKNFIERTFTQVAQERHLKFTVEFHANLPRTIYTDVKRLQQILKNLLSNAFKFTEKGEVRLSVATVTQGWGMDDQSLNQAKQVIAFAVSDTGVGIELSKQKVIFEAFQQADGTTSRKYGGTGLGLSISREITRLLGGKITLVSQFGKGSTFTLYLPQIYQESKPETVAAIAPSASATQIPDFLEKSGISSPPPVSTPSSGYSSLLDDRDQIVAGDRTLLVIEDDDSFSQILVELGHNQSFKILVATQGEIGLRLAHQYKPDAIILDIALPILDGWVVLDHLKHDLTTRHIPVHIITITERDHHQGLRQGAASFWQKPISNEQLNQVFARIQDSIKQEPRHLLLVASEVNQQQQFTELVSNQNVLITAINNGTEALNLLQTQPFDCLIVDLSLADMDGISLIQHIREENAKKDAFEYLPIIAYANPDLSDQQRVILEQADAVIVLKEEFAMPHLFDKTTLMLHQPIEQLSAKQQQLLRELQQKAPELRGKKILIVDDDVRNVFALTSMLESFQLKVIYADGGANGIALLQSTPDVDVVLMDIMMPEMDGYEAIQAIRQIESFQRLPIIALTAKAMQGDRQKCLEAGASDYIPKPVDIQQLLSLLRVWLRC
ncbi:HAMP domain-containing protein [Planktothrix paucivesiculata]|uniref:Circadian input-output histidine kinase CikA n=1 Tax=Planktothrix paucivesiculata PCC 9631 TaxID=671071 RepID=A0A7Z9BY79_9CYAN|nr:HAMP domain-containing protein [Planktothrix paucivesiculata]VXD24979.1 Putative Sensor histidine kinase with a GAF domain and multiple HAMP and Response regulator receiver domains (modular protein) [Planktothrix paucivesiculata PCC 9631]